MTLPNRTYGIEIEIKNLTTGQAALALQNAGIPAYDAGYTHNVSSQWKCVTDGSLSGTACEIVSPILRGEEGLETIKKVCRALNAAGGRIDRQCGLHVHVGTDGLSANDVGMIASRYARFEEQIDSWMPRSRRQSVNTYCMPIAGYMNRVNGHSFGTIDQVRIAFGGNRYVKLNLEAYTRHRTIEFRQHSGTCNGTKIENWIRFILHFIETSRESMLALQAAQPVTEQVVSGTPNIQNNSRRVNSLETKFDNVIIAMRNAPSQRMSASEIAAIGDWSVASVPVYMSRLRAERRCILRASRGCYILIGSAGRLSTDSVNTSNTTSNYNPCVEVTHTVQRAARRIVSVGHIDNDTPFRGIPDEVVAFYMERAEEFGNMNQ
jgi:hypothetical protein